MALTSEQFTRAIEEYKEIGHEYRYREQIMVQEFSLAMVTIAALLNVLLRDPQPPIWGIVVLQVFGTVFLGLLALHLRNINQDRLAALERKKVLLQALEFVQPHQNVDGTKRASAPRFIVLFAKVTAGAWVVWSVATWVNALAADTRPSVQKPAAAASK